MGIFKGKQVENPQISHKKGAGIVHRSPHQEGNYRRLYLTIDFVESFMNIYGRSLKF